MKTMIWRVPQAAEQHFGFVLLVISLLVRAMNLAFTDTSYQVKWEITQPNLFFIYFHIQVIYLFHLNDLEWGLIFSFLGIHFYL